MIQIPIAHDELALIEEATAGFVTAHENRGNMSFHYTPLSANHYETTLVGLLGETAVKIYLGLDWTPDPFNEGPDVGTDIEVRSTRRSPATLITRPRDRDGRYVLAQIVSNRLVNLLGWTTLEQANIPRHYRNVDNPYYSTPPAELQPIETLTPWRNYELQP